MINTAFHLYTGFFIKSEQTVPFAKIENVNRRTSVFHRICNMTSIQFETGMTGAEATVEFAVVSKEEADRLEAEMAKPANETGIEEEAREPVIGQPITDLPTENRTLDRNINFKTSCTEIITASFTLFEYLIYF